VYEPGRLFVLKPSSGFAQGFLMPPIAVRYRGEIPYRIGLGHHDRERKGQTHDGI
jgi:hypothetical protein